MYDPLAKMDNNNINHRTCAHQIPMNVYPTDVTTSINLHTADRNNIRATTHAQELSTHEIEDNKDTA